VNEAFVVDLHEGFTYCLPHPDLRFGGFFGFGAPAALPPRFRSIVDDRLYGVSVWQCFDHLFSMMGNLAVSPSRTSPNHS
ncbi:MAG: hypothetical protein ACXVHK_32515, partial [Solirubrobacteraceae bacterium]